MTLREYLALTGIPITKLADRLGISYHKLYYSLRGGCPSLPTVLALENYTGGLVRPVDFLTAEEKEEIYGDQAEQAKHSA